MLGSVKSKSFRHHITSDGITSIVVFACLLMVVPNGFESWYDRIFLAAAAAVSIAVESIAIVAKVTSLWHGNSSFQLSFHFYHIENMHCTSSARHFRTFLSFTRLTQFVAGVTSSRECRCCRWKSTNFIIRTHPNSAVLYTSLRCWSFVMRISPCEQLVSLSS